MAGTTQRPTRRAADDPRGRPHSRRRRLRNRAHHYWLRSTLRLRGVDPRPRRDPEFIVVGAQKAGSTSLFDYLVGHPQVAKPLLKEVHYFDLAFDRGQRWYRRFFPREDGSGRITGEASPSYMVYPGALERIARDLPRVKVVVILRDPVHRLLSHYRHEVRLGEEPLSLADALAREQDRIQPDLDAVRADPFHLAQAFRHYSYATRSFYSPQVRKIQELFGDRAFFVRLEDLTTPESFAPLCDFLGIEHVPGKALEARNVNYAVPVPDLDEIGPELLARLHEDADLTCELLGWEPWRAHETPAASSAD